jgi:hypothetical protein
MATDDETAEAIAAMKALANPTKQGRSVGRPRIYPTDAARQKADRERKKRAKEALEQEIARLRQEQQEGE